MGIPTIIESTKDVAEAAEQSLQPRARERLHAGITGLLNYLSAGSYRIAPWWSPQRDGDLDAFWKDSDHLSGSLALLTAKVVTVPVKVMPRDTRLKKNIADAERFNIILNEEADFGAGWITMLSKWLTDYWLTDNGSFLEIIGPGDPLGPIEGPPTGIAHLDSHRIQRTGNTEFPAIYTRPDGQRVKFHRSRITMTSDMPSAREEMFGVGFCAGSRIIHNAQALMDMATFKEEKLGSRPRRGIVIGKGIATDAILDSMAIADEQMDSRQLSIYSQLAVLGDIPTDADLSLLDLIGLPDGFDEDTSTRLAMFAIATGFGVPIRWIWPASVSGATKADAMYQHIAGLGGGIARILATLTMALGGDPTGAAHSIGKFLPPHLKLVFDFQDDEQDDMRASVRTKRSNVWKTDLEDGLLDMRAAREQALAAGDLTQAQFDRMELADGRLADGAPVLSLFHVDNEPFLSWLDLASDNPLAVSENDALHMLTEIDASAISVQDVIANSSNATTKEKAEQALAALGALKAMYAPLAQQQVQSDIMARFGAAPAAPAPASPTKPASETAPEQAAEEAQKQFGIKEGRFITKDGIRIFVGGPSSGGGGASSSNIVPNSDSINTISDLEKFADTSIPVTVDGVNVYAHSARHDSDIDSILANGFVPQRGETYWASRGFDRERGAGYILFKDRQNIAKESIDVVEPGEAYQEFRFTQKIPARDIVKVVRTVTDNTGFRIREDHLAQYAITHQGISQDKIDSLPIKYQRWFNLPGEATKDFDYSVQAGSIIGGELARGAGGRFISAAELKEQLRAEMIARMGGGAARTPTNSAATKRAANRAKVAEALGVDTEALAGMISGDTPVEMEMALAELGLATVAADGSVYLSPEGRKVLGAANSGDVDAAQEAMDAARKKAQGKGAGKGGAAKPSPEEKQRQREEAQRKIKEQNRSVVAEGLAGRIDQAAFSSLLSFVDGQEIDPAQADTLAQAGLLEIDPEGNPRLTQAGRSFTNAADKGDVRTAKDTLSRGEERVKAVLERAVQGEAAAAEYDENSDLAAFQADKQATQYEQGAEQLRGQIDGAVAPYDQQATGLDARATNYEQRAAKVEAQANGYEAQADQLAATVSSLPTQQQRAQAQQRIDELRQKAQAARDQADNERGKATDYRKQGLDLRGKGRTVRAELEKRVQELLDAARVTREQGAKAADEWRERADKMRQQVLEWRASVGNASLNKSLVGRVKKFFTKQRNPAIPTPADVQAAIDLWDADPNIPDRYKGILNAKRVKTE